MSFIMNSSSCSSKQTLILSTPGGVVAAFMTLFCGWYSDRKVSWPKMIKHTQE